MEKIYDIINTLIGLGKIRDSPAMDYEVVKGLLIEKIKNLFMNKFQRNTTYSNDTTYSTMERLIFKQQIIDNCNKITNNCIDTLINLDSIQIVKYMPLLNYEDIKQNFIVKLEEYYLYEHEIISAFNTNTENLPEIKIKISNIIKIGLKY